MSAFARAQTPSRTAAGTVGPTIKDAPRSPVGRGDVLAAFAMTEQVVMTSQERLHGGAVAVEAVKRASVSRKQALLDAVSAIDIIPRSADACQRAAFDALTEGLLTGALDACVAITTAGDAAAAGAKTAVPSFARDLIVRGVDGVQVVVRRQKRAAIQMVGTAATYPLLSGVTSVRAWRDFLSTVFALGYGIATSDAALLLVAHERPALLLGD